MAGRLWQGTWARGRLHCGHSSFRVSVVLPNPTVFLSPHLRCVVQRNTSNRSVAGKNQKSAMKV
jgi:hypothetical protein